MPLLALLFLLCSCCCLKYFDKRTSLLFLDYRGCYKEGNIWSGTHSKGFSAFAAFGNSTDKREREWSPKGGACLCIVFQCTTRYFFFFLFLLFPCSFHLALQLCWSQVYLPATCHHHHRQCEKQQETPQLWSGLEAYCDTTSTCHKPTVNMWSDCCWANRRDVRTIAKGTFNLSSRKCFLPHQSNDPLCGHWPHNVVIAEGHQPLFTVPLTLVLSSYVVYVQFDATDGPGVSQNANQQRSFSKTLCCCWDTCIMIKTCDHVS